MRRLGLALAAVLVLAGCGKDEPPPATTAPAAKLDPKLIAGLGDSITAGSPLWDPDPAFREQIAAGRSSDRRSQWGYWYEREHPGERVRNCGVFGERTDEIARRFEGCTRGAGRLVVQGGINDIAQGRSVEGAAGSLEAMVVKGKRSGREVALVEVLPWNNGFPDAAAPIDELNGRIRAIGERQDVPVLPWFRALEDPAAKGRMRADLTIDGDHPTVAGYKRLAGLVDLP